jgi:hypothetical protein
MIRIEKDVDRLVKDPRTLTMLDGLLIGAAVGAAGAALVIFGQLVATRRLARRLRGPAGNLPPLGPPPEGSPL